MGRLVWGPAEPGGAIGITAVRPDRNLAVGARTRIYCTQKRAVRRPCTHHEIPAGLLPTALLGLEKEVVSLHRGAANPKKSWPGGRLQPYRRLDGPHGCRRPAARSSRAPAQRSGLSGEARIAAKATPIAALPPSRPSSSNGRACEEILGLRTGLRIEFAAPPLSFRTPEPLFGARTL
jgi:hypothetical protein